MKAYAEDLHHTGLEVIDFDADDQFRARPLRSRDVGVQFDAMQRLAEAFAERPDSMLDELVRAATELCGADSAGISVEQPEGGEREFYRWVATTGLYSGFLNAVLPQHPSACSVTLDRGKAQHFRVTKEFFDILGVEAAPVRDGILLPWVVGETRGTIFVMNHERADAFDMNDVRMMTTLANFAAMAVRHQMQHKQLLAQAALEAESRLSRELAHQFNNPLQSLTNGVFLTAAGKGRTTHEIAQSMSEDVARLSNLVREILKLPTEHVN